MGTRSSDWTVVSQRLHVTILTETTRMGAPSSDWTVVSQRLHVTILTETTRMGAPSSDWTVVSQKLHVSILELRPIRQTLPIASNDPVVPHTHFCR